VYKGKYLKMLASWDFEGLYDVVNHFACSCGSQSHDRQSTTDISLQAGSNSDICNQSSIGLSLKEGSNVGKCQESQDTSNKS
jgi:hypothetical protein